MEPTKRRSVCILTTSKVATDQRILKQIRTIQNRGMHVVAIGYGTFKNGLPRGLEYHSLRQPVLIQQTLPLSKRLTRLAKEPKRFVSYANSLKHKFKVILSKIFLLVGHIIPQVYILAYWLNDDSSKLKDIAASSGCDFFHANDIMTLPAALAASSGAPVVFDAHEYAPSQFYFNWRERHLINPYQDFLCRHYIPRVTKMTTVCDSIAKLYKQKTGITPTVIRNVPPYEKRDYRPTKPQKIRMVHHGGATPQRFLEDMIRVVGLLPKHYTLTFMFTLISSRSAAYIEKLRNIAEEEVPGRVTFAQPVPYAKLIKVLNNFDIGIYILRQNQHINYKYILPNKLFEFIMAGLCVAINPSVEMAKIVKRYDCGIVADDDSPQGLAATISRLYPKDIDKHKNNSLAAAKELNAEIEMKKLITIYDELQKNLLNQ